MTHAKLTLACISFLAFGALLGASASASAACPNEALRAEHPSANLPDCRAYEQASPVDKNGGDVVGAEGVSQASPDGQRVTFFSLAGVPGGSGAQDYPIFLASRGADAWSTQGLFPPPSFGQSAAVLDWTPDLAYAFSIAGKLNGNVSTSGKLNGNVSTYLSRSSSDGSFATLAPYTSGARYFFVGASADHSKVFFEANGAELTPEAAPGKDNLYVWDRETGALSLAGILPDSACATPPCVPPGGSFAGPFNWWNEPTNPVRGGAENRYYTQYEPAVSNNGSVFFTAGESGQIYLRTDPTGPGAATVQISASEKKNGAGDDDHDIAGTRPAVFQAATPDGSKAFFTSSEKLTDDANTGPEPPAPAIARSDLEGHGANLSFLPAHAAGIAIQGERIYWANPTKDSIGRAKLNGNEASTEVEEEFIAGAENPRDVAVDSEHIYWTNAGDGKEGTGSIGRADIEGTLPSVKQDFITGATNPLGIDVDASHIYWVNVGARFGISTRTVGRAELDGTEVGQEFIQAVSGDVAVNASKIYSSGASEGDGFIRRVNLDGENEDEFLFTVPGTEEGPSLALDGSHLYWTNNGEGTIGRSELNGTSPEESFISGADHPKGLALDGSHIYWPANQDADPNPGNDLYRYDAGTKSLTDLTVDTADKNGAEVQGVIGVSEDGSYVYFVANGDLDGVGGPATPGDCRREGSGNGVHTSGTCNLYLLHGGTTTFIARLDATGPFDVSNWQPLPFEGERTGRVSPDGRTLLFRSQRQLTGYDNDGPKCAFSGNKFTAGTCAEIYRYRVGDPNPLLCVSCDPSGAAPLGEPRLKSKGTRIIDSGSIGATSSGRALPRSLSADGNRVFFESPDELADGDANSRGACPDAAFTLSCQDVYEWEAPDTGSCEESSPAFSSQDGGCLFLLSSGKGAEPSFLADASASGDDAFFFTREPLVSADRDEVQDVYDARTEGGLASQNILAPVPCEGEACKAGASVPPGFQSPGSSSFAGPGNPKQATHKKHRRHRKHGHKRNHRAAKSNGRASR
jgi:virginiamycin B lyase